MTISPDREREFALKIRIPGWARKQPVPGDLYRFAAADGLGAALSVNGKPVELRMEKGYARIERRWKRGRSRLVAAPHAGPSWCAPIPCVEDDRGKSPWNGGR